MGIRSLTKFVNERFTGWRRGPVEGELIIDGFSLCYEFMRDDSDIFGGNYMTLARDIGNFFETLIICRIKPFLIFDGTNDDKKHTTLVTRTHEKLDSAAAVSAALANNTCRRTSGSNDRVLEPQLSSYVMLDTLKRVLGEDRVFVADGDADIDIASLGIHHRSPVLSNDSDFYIFPLQYSYIPFSKFHWNNPRNNTIYAEFYSYELFCKQFGISDLSLLAVIPAIIGNDMMPQLDSQDRNKILPPDPECNSVIERVVMYASSFTTLEACIHSLQQQDLIDPADVVGNIQRLLFYAMQLL